MTPQDLQIAVAEKCGFNRTNAGWFAPPDMFGMRDEVFAPPPYSTSLNAIQKAAMEKFKTTDERTRFEQRLNRAAVSRPGIIWQWQLTAADWCIAFLETCKEIENK